MLGRSEPPSIAVGIAVRREVAWVIWVGSVIFGQWVVWGIIGVYVAGSNNVKLSIQGSNPASSQSRLC